MDNLYKDLAPVYEAMYYSFINYKEEYAFYSAILRKYKKKSLLEIGSGTGNLAKQFVENGYDYTGFDLSKEMIAIAKTKVPEGDFLQGDMRDFELDKAVGSMLMTGRTISYLLTNKDVNSCFKKVHENLVDGGVFCFDFIDASKFIPEIGKGKKITHEANYKGIHYLRKSIWNLNLAYGMDVHWDSIYYKKDKGKLLEIGRDDSIFRTFSKDEMVIFLTINDFKVREIFARASYAFPTYVVVAEKG